MKKQMVLLGLFVYRFISKYLLTCFFLWVILWSFLCAIVSSGILLDNESFVHNFSKFLYEPSLGQLLFAFTSISQGVFLSVFFYVGYRICSCSNAQGCLKLPWTIIDECRTNYNIIFPNKIPKSRDFIDILLSFFYVFFAALLYWIISIAENRCNGIDMIVLASINITVAICLFDLLLRSTLLKNDRQLLIMLVSHCVTGAFVFASMLVAVCLSLLRNGNYIYVLFWGFPSMFLFIFSNSSQLLMVLLCLSVPVQRRCCPCPTPDRRAENAGRNDETGAKMNEDFDENSNEKGENEK